MADLSHAGRRPNSLEGRFATRAAQMQQMLLAALIASGTIVLVAAVMMAAL